MVAWTRLNVTFYVRSLLHTTFSFQWLNRSGKSRFVEQLEIKTCVELNSSTLWIEKRRLLPNGRVCSNYISVNTRTLDDGKITTKLVRLTILEKARFVANCS